MIDIETSVVCKQADRGFGAINYDIDMNKKTKWTKNRALRNPSLYVGSS